VETFPRVVDLSLPVGMVKARDRFLIPPGWSIDSSLYSSDDEPLEFEVQFDAGTVEGMVKNIREIVENELVGGSDDSHPRAKGVDYATRALSSCTPISASSPKVNVATILARFCFDVVLDRAGTPSRHPKNYQVRPSFCFFLIGRRSLTSRSSICLPTYILLGSADLLRPGLVPTSSRYSDTFA
jgi:hypothetical protein